MRAALPACLAAAAMLWCGCARIDAEPPGGAYRGPVNSCVDDGDCEKGSCHETLGVCAVGAPAGVEGLYVKVIPDPATGAASQVFEVSLDADGRIATTLDVKVPVVINAATLAGEDAPSHLQATVIFTHVGNRLPGHPPTLTVYEADGAVFELSLPSGEYGIMAIPGGGPNGQAGTFPVYYMDDVTIDSTGTLRDSEGEPTDLIVPAATSHVEGVVRQGGLPVNGLEVTAVDPATGRIVSTITETACSADGFSCGRFRLGLAPGAETFSLKISRRFEPHHPVFELEGFTAGGDGEVLDVDVSLDPLGVPVKYLADVERPVTGVDGAVFDDPAPGCFVLFESDDVAGGTVEKWVSTNESGALEETDGVLGVNLYPGDYRVTVIPAVVPADASTDYSAFVSEEPITISGAGGIDGQVFSLALRPRVEGTVRAGGEGVPGCTVTSEPMDGAPSTARGSTLASSQGGDFSMWMDEGRYLVVAEAPAESRYGWGVAETDVSEDGAIALALPIPYVAYGEVVPSGDQVDPIDVGGTVLEWYRVRDGMAYAVGRVAADTEGAFTVLLPP